MTQPKRHVYREQSFPNMTALDGISDAQVGEHLALYTGYVKQVNALNKELQELRSEGRASGKDLEFAELTRRLGFEYNGMILHEFYFSNLRAGGPRQPAAGSSLAQALTDSFGTFEQWLADFKAIGGMRGIGWVVLCEDPVLRRLSNHWITLHQDGYPASFKPLLVMDVWEHAFMRDYKATEKDRYLDAFFKNVDWQTVERRLQEPMAIRPAAAA